MAQHVDIIINRLQTYFNAQLNALSQNNPLIALAQPLVKRVINNNTYKLESVLKQISNKDGMVDIDEILSEMIDSIMKTRPFKMDTQFLGELEIGGGRIKMNLPLVDKALVLSHQDLMKLKEILSKEQIIE